MKFTTVAAALFGAVSVQGAVIKVITNSTDGAVLATGEGFKTGPGKYDVAVEAPAVEKRVIVTILTTVAAAAISEAVVLAIDAAAALIKEVTNWTNARETFTQATVKAMWEKNPDKAAYPSAVCYNLGYGFKNSDHSQIINSKLSTGTLHTDYDCFYLGKGNSFYTWGAGGYINYATYGNCAFQSDSGDLYC